MADENEKITLRFESSDSDDILQAEPFNVWRTVNSIEYLDLLNDEIAEAEEEGLELSDLIVFVKNVEGVNTDLPKSGAYFVYTYSDDKKAYYWQQIMLGTHSHVKKKLLDQIGSNLSEGVVNHSKDGIVFMGVKLTEDHDYQIVYKDLNDVMRDYKPGSCCSCSKLSEAPEHDEGTTLFLTHTSDGKVEWAETNFPLPTNSFGYFTTVITEECDVITTDLIFDTETDQVLLMVNGLFIQQPEIEVDSETSILSLKLPDDESKFEVDDAVTVVVIRDAVNYVFNILKSNYLTKEEALEILADGEIDWSKFLTADNLSEYVTYSDINNYISGSYSVIDHDHDLVYAKVDHLHDDRYVKITELEDSIDARVNVLLDSDQLNNVIATLKEISDYISGDSTLEALLNSKANLTDVYTKEESNALYPLKSSVYTKAEVDYLLVLNRVTSVNGKTGDVVLTAADIQFSSDTSTSQTVKDVIEILQTKAASDEENISELQTQVAGIISGDTPVNVESLSGKTVEEFVLREDADYVQLLSDTEENNALRQSLEDVIYYSEEGKCYYILASKLYGTVDNFLLSDSLITYKSDSIIIVERDRSGNFVVSNRNIEISDIVDLKSTLERKVDSYSDTYTLLNELATAIAADGYYTKTEIDALLLKDYYTKDEVKDLILNYSGVEYTTPEVIKLIGTVDDIEDLPSSDNTVGDAYIVTNAGATYIWVANADGNGNEGWVLFSNSIDLSEFYTKDEVDSKFQKKISNSVKDGYVIVGDGINDTIKTSTTKLDDLVTQTYVTSLINNTTFTALANSFAFVITPSDITEDSENNQIYATKIVNGLYLNTKLWVNANSVNAAQNTFKLYNYAVINTNESTIKFYFDTKPTSGYILIEGMTENVSLTALTGNDLSEASTTAAIVTIAGAWSGMDKNHYSDIHFINCGSSSTIMY